MSATISPRRSRLPRGLGPTLLLAVSLAGLLAVIWGALYPVEVRVEYVDAGPVDRFAIGEVSVYPEHNVYVVGLADGRLRALDGRIPGSECSVRWLPNDRRGREHNPLGRPGVFEDPCTGALWSAIGNAIEGTDEPMKTPYIDYRRSLEDGALHAFVELVNPDSRRP